MRSESLSLAETTLSLVMPRAAALAVESLKT